MPRQAKVRAALKIHRLQNNDERAHFISNSFDEFRINKYKRKVQKLKRQLEEATNEQHRCIGDAEYQRERRHAIDTELRQCQREYRAVCDRAETLERDLVQEQLQVKHWQAKALEYKERLREADAEVASYELAEEERLHRGDCPPTPKMDHSDGSASGSDDSSSSSSDDEDSDDTDVQYQVVGDSDDDDDSDFTPSQRQVRPMAVANTKPGILYKQRMDAYYQGLKPRRY